MDKIFFKIAGFNILIKLNPTETPYFVEKLVKKSILYEYPGFLAKKENRVDYTIDVVYKTKFEILIKNDKKSYFINFFEQLNAKQTRTYYHISMNQFKVILRTALQNLLAKSKGLILHGSAVLIKNKAVVFVGKSGAGKSTISKLLSEKYPILADDNLILKLEGKKLYIYQSPFIEKNFFKKSSKKYELSKIFILKKSNKNEFYKIKKIDEIHKKIIEQMYSETGDLEKQIKILLKIISRFKEIYNLEFKLKNAPELIELLGRERID